MNYMVTDADLKLVLCKQKDKKKFENHIDCFTQFQFLTEMCASNPTREITGDDSCYIMYTSGSTGQPKGVLNYHAGLVNHFETLNSRILLNQLDRTLQKTPLSFDAALLEIFLPLCSGASVHITEPGKQKDLHAICHELEVENCTFLSLTPSYLCLLSEIIEKSNEKIEWLLLGGESLSNSIYRLAHKSFPNARIFNLYGPCEAAIDSLIFEVKKASPATINIPIGKPIKNMQAYVVNQNMQLVPDNTEGELLISGLGVGGPYVGSACNNANKFIFNPFGSKKCYRTYKTGDMVKKNADGNFFFLGRFDHQVKILGVRIEIEEIENNIKQIKGIKQVAVIYKNNMERGVSCELRAHYSCFAEKINPKTIQRELAKVLPKSMIPNVYIFHENVPLKPSGKIDRLVLDKCPTRLYQSLGVRNNLFTRNPEDKKIKSIWSQVLRSPIDYESDFFSLGGNSILAVTLMNKIKLTFQHDFELQLIYRHSVYGEFIEKITSQLGK